MESSVRLWFWAHICMTAAGPEASDDHHQNSRPVCPAVVECIREPLHTLTTRQSPTFARPVVPDCICNRFRLLSAIFRLLSAFFRLLWQSFPFALNFFRLLCAFFRLLWQSFPFALNFSDCSVPFSDCSSSRLQLLSNFFRLRSTFFRLLLTLSDCSVPFSVCTSRRFWLLDKLFYMLIHINLTTG